MQLITIVNSQTSCYYERCKFIVNTVIKKLFITPCTNGEFDVKPIEVSFNGAKFVKVQNILLIDQIKNFGSCILFFSKADTCAKLFKVFQHHNVLNTLSSPDDELIENIVTKILNNFKGDKIQTKKLQAKIKQLMKKLPLLKQMKLKTSWGVLFNQKFDKNPEENTRKRKYSKSLSAKKKFVGTENFKIHEFDVGEKIKKRLIIFTSSEKDFCYEYFWNAFTKSYICCGCNRLKMQKCSAKIFHRLNGTDFVKYEKFKHICEPRKYNPEKYKFDPEKQIIEAPNFKVVKYEEFGVTKSYLIIFASDDKSRCYKYFLDKKKYYCSGCKVKSNKNVTAKILCNKDEKEYVRLDSEFHICEMKIYMSEKHIFLPSIKILTDNFKIMTVTQKGITKNMLIIFDLTNKKLCYEYFYYNISESYQCCGCKTKDISVAAFLFKDDSGKDFLRLGRTEHVCDLREFDEEKYSNHIIIKKPNFEFMEHFVAGIKKKKLIIFISEEKEFCYLFTLIDGKKYCCSKCSAHKYFVAAYVCQDDEIGDDYISINDKKHICKPVKYEPEKYNSKIIKPPAYQIINRKYNNRITKKLVVFGSHGLCYEYYWSAAHKYFKCSPCHSIHKTSVTAKLVQNESEGEYLILSPNEHKCELKKFKPEHGKIIKIPNFKLNISKDEKSGAERKHLMIFDENDKEKFYNYIYAKKKDHYFCGSCAQKHKYVTAKICIDENGETFVELGENEHICKPKTAMKIVNFPNFKIIFYSKNGKRKNSLIIFDSDDKNLCYQYSFAPQGHRTYFCDGCTELGTKNNAIVRRGKGNEKEFVEVQGSHVCQPKLYDSEEFIKTVKLPNFKIETNIKNGEQRKYLIVYSNLEQKMGYKYYFCKTKNHFVCCSCQRATKTTNITAKLRENKEGGDFVELCEREHICKPERYP